MTPIDPSKLTVRGVRAEIGKSIDSNLVISADKQAELKALAALAVGSDRLFSPYDHNRTEALASVLSELLLTAGGFEKQPFNVLEKAIRQGLANDGVLDNAEVEQVLIAAKQVHAEALTNAPHGNARPVRSQVLQLQRRGFIDDDGAKKTLLDGFSELGRTQDNADWRKLDEQYGVGVAKLSQYLASRSWGTEVSRDERKAFENIRFISVRYNTEDNGQLTPRLTIFKSNADEYYSAQIYKRILQPRLDSFGLNMRIETVDLDTPVKPPNSAIANKLRSVLAGYPALTRDMVGFEIEKKQSSKAEGSWIPVNIEYRADNARYENLKAEIEQKLGQQDPPVSVRFTKVYMGQVAERVKF